MTFRFVKTMPRRMVVLSLLPPPTAFEPPRPYGYGAFIVERRGASEAAFCLRVHGYGARYDPLRLRKDIRELFLPETQALIYAPLASDIRRQRLAKVPLPSVILDFVPRCGLRSNILVSLQQDLIAHAAGIAGIKHPSPEPSPLQRVGQLGNEAQAAWVYWLFKSCAPHLRRSLLASHSAWQAIEQARQSPVQTTR